MQALPICFCSVFSLPLFGFGLLLGLRGLGKSMGGGQCQRSVEQRNKNG
jgi:hypothetical protein